MAKVSEPFAPPPVDVPMSTKLQGVLLDTWVSLGVLLIGPKDEPVQLEFGVGTELYCGMLLLFSGTT